MTTPTLNWLEDPEVFQVNRLPAHFYYEKEKQVSLNGTWSFSYSSCPAKRPADFYKRDFDASSFGQIQVPGHIQLQGYGTCQYINTPYPWDGKEPLLPPQIPQKQNPVGSYLRFFSYEKEQEDNRVILCFHGVESACYVWLNGHFVGYSEDSFTPSEFDVTDLIQKGDNVLAVEVYQFCSGSWLEDQDFWRFSGIFRDVELYEVPRLHIFDAFLKAGCVHDYKDGLLEGEIALQGLDQKTQGTFRAVLLDCRHTPVWQSQELSLRSSLSFQAELPDIQPWSAERPYLYTLLLSLLDKEGRTIQTISQRIGFRTFEMKDRLMRLNGKRILFKGVNRHEFSARNGRCVTKEDMLFDIQFLKQNNINAVRTSHYPNHPLWYDLCDQYGIYLIDETNLETHGTWSLFDVLQPEHNVPASLPEWKACVLDRAASMLERDKNHPSVLIWSCGNESYAGDDIAAMGDYFRRKDPSRLVHYEGVTWNREYQFISDMESRMYAKPQDVEAYLQDNPSKPFINCEYTHAMGNSCGGLKLYTDLEDKYLMYQGGFIWDYVDQSLYCKTPDGEEFLAYGGDFDDRGTDYCFSTNGLLYGDRTLSPKVQEVKQLYSNIKLSFQENQAVIRNGNLFSDTGSLAFLFTLEKEGKILQRETRYFAVEPESSLTAPCPLSLPSEAGEYVFTLSAVLKADTPWAKAGHEVAFAQRILSQEGEAEKTALPSPEIVYGNVYVGVYGQDFSMLFSKSEGGLCSLIYHGREYITRTPKVSFWRALTDNDKGAGLNHTHAQWLSAGLGAKSLSHQCAIEEENGVLTLKFFYESGSVPSFIYTVSYRAYGDGSLEITVDYPGVKGLPSLPLLGIDFKLKKELSAFSWYGFGPEENYRDRKEGARLGVFSSSVKDNLSRYLIPQECGNRTGVRWVQAVDKAGKGIRFSSEGAPMECSVLPYSAYELENAMHIHELPKITYTWVRLMSDQMGVGGDDSWGAPVHEEYLLDSQAPRQLRFRITPV